MATNCPECGYPLNGDEMACPECGYPLSAHVIKDDISSLHNKDDREETYQTVSELFWSCQFYKVFKGKRFDLGQRIFEFGSLWWECVVVWWNCCATKFFKFSGRASRREYFSFIGFGVLPTPFLLSLYIVIGFIPWLSVSIRRMHDVGKSGWWTLVPIANIFLLFKESDKGVNKYGKQPQTTNNK